MLDLKRLYFLTGVENKPTVFLFNDTQALEESFLEDISNILSSGEVPNLYKPEEFEEVGIVCFLSRMFFLEVLFVYVFFRNRVGIPVESLMFSLKLCPVCFYPKRSV